MRWAAGQLLGLQTRPGLTHSFYPKSTPREETTLQSDIAARSPVFGDGGGTGMTGAAEEFAGGGTAG